MPRVVFERVCSGREGHGLFVQRMDAATKHGISPLMRVISALRLIAYAKFFDEVDEVCVMSELSERNRFQLCEESRGCVW